MLFIHLKLHSRFLPYIHIRRPRLDMNSINLVYCVTFGTAKHHLQLFTWYAISISFRIYLWIKVRWSCSLNIENGRFVGWLAAGFTCMPRNTSLHLDGCELSMSKIQCSHDLLQFSYPCRSLSCRDLWKLPVYATEHCALSLAIKAVRINLVLI